MALTTITDTLKDANGNNAEGYLVITWDEFKTSVPATIAAGRKRVPSQGNFNGSISIGLEPNDTATPTGTSYKVEYFMRDGTRRTERWVVPTSGPAVTIATVRVAVKPTPSATVQMAQLAQDGATEGQDLRWDNILKRWTPEALFDSTNPAALGTAGPGASLLAARRDHVHPAADLSTTHATGILAAARFPALTGDVTTSAGAVATTIAAAVVTSAKLDEKTIRYAEVSIAAAAIATLRATPAELVAAPGAGKVLEFISVILILDFTTPAFTEAGYNLAVRYTNGSGVIVSQTIETTGFIDQSADTMTNALAKIDAIGLTANAALVLHNIGAAEFGGSGGSTLRVKTAYRVHTTGL